MKPEPEEKTGPYRWFKARTGDLGRGDKWIVVIGCNFVDTVTDGAVFLSIRDRNSVVIDKIVFRIVTSGAAVETLPRKMLIPPGGDCFPDSLTLFMSLVECDTLDDALRIL